MQVFLLYFLIFYGYLIIVHTLEFDTISFSLVSTVKQVNNIKQFSFKWLHIFREYFQCFIGDYPNLVLFEANTYQIEAKYPFW